MPPSRGADRIGVSLGSHRPAVILKLSCLVERSEQRYARLLSCSLSRTRIARQLGLVLHTQKVALISKQSFSFVSCFLLAAGKESIYLPSFGRFPPTQSTEIPRISLVDKSDDSATVRN
ncbi:hypothetical protein V6N11_050219 [Hibiscus sabdariffa]|uniref:Uncharacterized protein n=1 Tax=Hibiscus sabdariffa TaxID=183260 RepID=A0ABR2T9U2_9ROSI